MDRLTEVPDRSEKLAAAAKIVLIETCDLGAIVVPERPTRRAGSAVAHCQRRFGCSPSGAGLAHRPRGHRTRRRIVTTASPSVARPAKSHPNLQRSGVHL
jgi:hypothetical protein